MQKIKDKRLEEIQNRINEYDIRFPVAEIAETTGFDKGNVSAMLKGKKAISDNFWTKFLAAYPPREILKVAHHGNISQSLTSEGVKVTLQDYLNLQKEMITRLSEDKERLFSLLNSSLVRISDDQQIALAYQKAWVEYEAEKAAKGDPKKKREIISHMGKLVDGKLMGGVKEDKNPGPGI